MLRIICKRLHPAAAVSDAPSGLRTPARTTPREPPARAFWISRAREAEPSAARRIPAERLDRGAGDFFCGILFDLIDGGECWRRLWP